MTDKWVNFKEFLEFLESHGWKLQRIQGLNRIFVKEGKYFWSIPVHSRKVNSEYVKKFKEFLKERGEI